MKLAHAALSGLRSNIAARSPQNESAANVPTMFQFIQSIAMPPNDFLFARPPRAGGESIAEYGFPQVYVKYTFARKTALKYTARDGAQIGGFILEPLGSEGQTLTTILYCHGGAFFMPILPSSLEVAATYVTRLNCRVFMPEYRLTPKNPYPVPINDCYDALAYVAGLDNVDVERVIIYGESAGGCLAAETLHMCRDEGLLDPVAAMLIYPVADNAQDYPSLTNYEHATWSREANLNMWKLYLAGVDVSSSDYAVPMQQEDFSGYPPVYIEPSEMDTLCDQDIALAEKMRAAGVDVSGEMIPGAYHGFDGNLDSELVKSVLDVRIGWLEECLSSEGE